MAGGADKDARTLDLEEAEARDLDLIRCDDCGRSFATEDGPGMIAGIKGPCPDCGGTFRLEDRSN
jgi:hypothetical protein